MFCRTLPGAGPRRSKCPRNLTSSPPPLDERQVSRLAWRFVRAGQVRGSVLYFLACIRYHHQPQEVTADQAREALAETKRGGMLWHIANASQLVGNVLRDQGYLSGALNSYHDSLTMRQKLTKRDPENTACQRDLSVTHAKIGHVLRAEGDHSGALNSYRDSLGIAERLVKRDPNNTNWQRDLSLVYSDLGNALQEHGERSEAQAAFEKSLAIIWRLIEQDPSNASLQWALAVVHGRVRDILQGWLKTSPVGRHIDYLIGPVETELIDMELLRPSVPGDIKQVAIQELTAYSENDAVPEYILREWYTKNPSGFNMIFYGDKPIGHLNLLPFKEDFLARYIEGTVIEKEATADDIYPPESRSSIRDLYVESFAILTLPRNLRGKVLIEVLSKFAEIASRVCPINQIRYIYALAATKDGKNLLSHLHFSEVTREHPRKDGLSFFCVLYTDLVRELFQCLETTQKRDTLKQIANNVLKGGI